MAPEVLLLASYKGSALEAAVSKRVGEKMDVWSLGVCLFELAAGMHACMHGRKHCAADVLSLPLGYAEPVLSRHPPPITASCSKGLMQWGFLLLL